MLSRSMVNNRSDDPLEYEREAIECTELGRRYELAAKYAWAIPSTKAIELIRKYLPITEIGAGSGYWAHLIGGDITCHDIMKSHFTFTEKYHPIIYDGEPDLSKTLFFCWPPYEDPMAYNYLKKHTGEYVIYIGEGRGGCTADHDFHDYLDSHYTRVECLDIPQWCIRPYKMMPYI